MNNQEDLGEFGRLVVRLVGLYWAVFDHALQSLPCCCILRPVKIVLLAHRAHLWLPLGRGPFGRELRAELLGLKGARNRVSH